VNRIFVLTLIIFIIPIIATGIITLNMVKTFEKTILLETPDYLSSHQNIKILCLLAKVVILLVMCFGILLAVLFAVRVIAFSTYVSSYEKFIYYKLDLYNQRWKNCLQKKRQYT